MKNKTKQNKKFIKLQKGDNFTIIIWCIGLGVQIYLYYLYESGLYG